MNQKEFIADYKGIRLDYEWDIFNDDPDKVAAVKEIIATRLTEPDRIIFLMYTDCKSLRKLAKRLGVSHMTVRNEVARIRKTIIEIYDKEKWKRTNTTKHSAA